MSNRPDIRRLGFHDGIRAAVTWLHAEAKAMNDPHAAGVLNNAAFHLGQKPPTFSKSDAPEQRGALEAEIAALVSALEPFARFGRGLRPDAADNHDRPATFVVSAYRRAAQLVQKHRGPKS